MDASILRPTRRRLLFIGAALLGGAALPGLAAAAPVGRWSGQALGAHCTIRLVGCADGAPVFAAVEAELRRLEAIFSLYRTDGELARLNRDGRLDRPSPELLEVLSLSKAVHLATGGLFDPTVQPLFDLHARHFAAPGADPAGPPPEAGARALAAGGLDGLGVDPAAIRFRRPGMGVTLNGIAQGFVTDRIAALLAAEGYGDMLLDLGEIRALGSREGAGGWSVLVGDIADRRRVRLTDEAIATSSPLGTTLDAAGRVGHIFDPRRGWTGGFRRPVSLVAPTAALADAFSTAAVLMDDRALAAALPKGVRRV